MPPIPFFTLNFLVFIISHSKVKIICKRYLYGKFCALNDSACFLVNNIQIIYRIAVKIRTFQRESYLENSVLRFACLVGLLPSGHHSQELTACHTGYISYVAGTILPPTASGCMKSSENILLLIFLVMLISFNVTFLYINEFLLNSLIYS